MTNPEPAPAAQPSTHPGARPAAPPWFWSAWFGPQIGSTVWLITGAVEFRTAAPRIALAWLACFVVANGLGCWLWRYRNRFRPLQGVQMLMLVIGIIGLLAFAILDWAAPPAVRAMQDPRQGYRFIGVGLPLMIGWFAWMDHESQRKGPGQPPATPHP